MNIAPESNGPQLSRPPIRQWGPFVRSRQWVSIATKSVKGALVGLSVGSILAVSLATTSCSSDFSLENREIPIHVWLSAPGFTTGGGRMHARISVDQTRVVDDVVQYPKGSPTVNLPAVYLRTGTKTVTAEFGRGQIRIQRQVEVEGECWLQITVAGNQASIVVHEEEPSPWGTLER